MFSIEDLERALNATNQQRAALKAQGYSDGAINHILTHGTSSIVATSPIVAYVGSEPIYNFDVTDHYEGSLPTSATHEERIVAEGRKWSAANAALKTHMEENLHVGPSKQQQAHYLEIVCIKAQSLAYYPNIPALNFYKDSLPELEAKNIVQYEIDCLGWYGAVRNAIAGLNLPQLQNYINQRDWDKVSQQIIQDRINDVLGHPRRNFLEEELIAKQNYQVPVETIQFAMQKAIHAVGETVEQQKANDLLYATIEQANRQIRPSDREEYGLTALEIPPQVIGNPGAIHRYLTQIEPLTRSLYLRWEATWYKPDKPLGGFIGKVGREFNKGLGNMGPIGKIVKPLIHLAAVASGNPYIVIGTSVTMGTLDRGAEGAVRGLMFGIMGAAGQQLAIAQQAGIPLVGENVPTGTLVSNPEALQVVQDLRALTTEQLSMAPSRITIVGQAVNLTEEAIRTGLYMAPMAYSYATELTASTGDPVHDALIRRRRREFYINLAGMGAGTFVSTSSIPLFEGQNTFVMSLGTGAIFGAISSGISRGRPLRGALEGAFFAGAGNIIEGRLSQSEFLQEAHRLREALGVAASSALHIVVRHGRGRDILIGIGSDLLGYAIVPPGIGVINEQTLRMFVTGAIATLTSNTELGESMMAAWLGSNVQRIARQYGNNVARNYQERRQPITNDRSEERKSSKSKAENNTWRSNALKMATQKASAELVSNNIHVPDEKIQQAFERQPILQGSREEIIKNLIALGKADGPVKDNRSAFVKGFEKVFGAVLDSLISKTYAGEMQPTSNLLTENLRQSKASQTKPSIGAEVANAFAVGVNRAKDYPVTRAIINARDGVADMLLHPIDTAKNTATLLWDASGAASQFVFGTSTEGSRNRNQERWKGMIHLYDAFVEGDWNTRVEIGTQLVTSGIFVTALGGSMIPLGRTNNTLRTVSQGLSRNANVRPLVSSSDIGVNNNLFFQYKNSSQPRIKTPCPAEIYYGFSNLSKRQSAVLERLPKVGSSTLIKKSDFNVADLASLTAKTGDEFAMFTLGGRRLIVRGDQSNIYIDHLFSSLKQEGWTWSAHTHPGITHTSLIPSGKGGDRSVLELINQEQSLILNSTGKRSIFGVEEGVHENLSTNSIKVRRNTP